MDLNLLAPLIALIMFVFAIVGCKIIKRVRESARNTVSVSFVLRWHHLLYLPGGAFTGVALALAVLLTFSSPAWMTGGRGFSTKIARQPCVTTNITTDGSDDQAQNRLCNVEHVINGARAASDCATARRRDTEATCFSVATLEFDSKGKLREAKQFAKLIDEARQLMSEADVERQQWTASGVQHTLPRLYVIAYVHGWRHDARAGDSDLTKVRLIASSAARNIKDRCAMADPCPTRVLAIYLTWPAHLSFDVEGQVLEKDPFKWDANGVLGALSFPYAKKVSDGVGKGMLGKLKEFRASIGNQNTKMMLVGHSLGGNALLTALNGETWIGNSVGPADLTVLWNPATEVSKWREFRRKSPLPPQTGILSGPSVIAVGTPHVYDPLSVPEKNYDSAVGLMFMISQTLFAQKTHIECNDVEHNLGFGHTAINYKKCASPDMRFAYSHYMEMNATQNTETGTTYENTASQDNSCSVEAAFLTCARSRNGANEACINQYVRNRNWDFGGVADDNKSLGLTRNIWLDIEHDWPPPKAFKGDNAIDEKKCSIPAQEHDHVPNGGKQRQKMRRSQQINVQFGVGLYPGDRNARDDFRPAWGVRANANTVVEHGGFVSAPVLCAINKLVLDAPAGPLPNKKNTKHPYGTIDASGRVAPQALPLNRYAKTLIAGCRRT